MSDYEFMASSRRVRNGLVVMLLFGVACGVVGGLSIGSLLWQ